MYLEHQVINLTLQARDFPSIPKTYKTPLNPKSKKSLDTERPFLY